MELITITHKRYTIGFGKSKTLTHQGVRFDNGKIAYMDEDEIICSSASEKDLKKALVDAQIEVK